jgi:hypothetical protein
MDRLDAAPFRAHGAAGAFALGVMEGAAGDGERAAWTVCAPLGVTTRTVSSFEQQCQDTQVDPRVEPAHARIMAETVVDLFSQALAARGLHQERAFWEQAVLSAAASFSWRSKLTHAAVAFFGFGGVGGLQLKLHDAVKQTGDEDLVSVLCRLSNLLWSERPYLEGGSPWCCARRAGELAVALVPLLGEQAWEAIALAFKLARLPRAGGAPAD